MNVYDIIRERMKGRIPFNFLRDLFGDSTVYVGGNSCNAARPNDIDIFPSTPSMFSELVGTLHMKKVHILATTANAITVKHDNTVIQFCRYYHPSLEALVRSFDFAHIQIGVSVNGGYITEIYYTPEWEQAHCLETTEFTGSEYPFSSLLRLLKYKDRGVYHGKSYIRDVIAILNAIVSRGFKDYSDFKDQLDAIDLGLVPEDLEGCQPELR